MEENQNEFGQRFKHLIENVLHTTLGKFSLKTGVDKATLSKIINKGSVSGFDKLANIINAYPQVNVEWLLTGKGEPLKTNRVTDEEVLSHPLFRALLAKFERIERLLNKYLQEEALGKLTCDPKTALALTRKNRNRGQVRSQYTRALL